MANVTLTIKCTTLNNASATCSKVRQHHHHHHHHQLVFVSSPLKSAANHCGICNKRKLFDFLSDIHRLLLENTYLKTTVLLDSGVSKGEGVMRGSNTLSPLAGSIDRSTVKHALQNTQNDCHQWLSGSRVHRMRSRPPRTPLGGAYSAPPDPIAGLTRV